MWKAEPILYSDTALNYLLKIVSKLLSEQRVICIAFLVAAFPFYSDSLLDTAFVM